MTAKEHAVGLHRSNGRSSDGRSSDDSDQDTSDRDTSDRDTSSGPGFDIALWGYDRRQVDRCLDDFTGRLEEALSQLDLVEALQVQLYQAQLEIERLRHQPVAEPAWSDRLANIMAAAEYLWSQAVHEADGVRDGGAARDGGVARDGGAARNGNRVSNGAVTARSGLR